MTLTEYEAAVQALPGYQKGAAAGPAYALRQRIALGEPFVASRDAIVSMKQHHDRLQKADQLANFSALTGP